jgi:TetR/AcrR family transcriptional repressor of bet genes
MERCWSIASCGKAVSAENHETRRARIAEIALGVIAREGLESATIRRIAAEVGYSTAVVTYYFENKQDLLLSVMALLGELNRARFDECAARTPPDLVGYLLSMSAIRPEDRANWRAWVSFWERSLDTPELAVELRGWIGQVLPRIEWFIAALAPAHAERTRIATQLFDLVQGISTHMLFDPDRWTPDAVRATLDETVDLLLGL